MVMFIGMAPIGLYTLKIICDNETLNLFAPNLAEIQRLILWFHIKHISIESTLLEEDKRAIRELFK